MAPDPQYLSILVALDAALLLILAGVAKRQLDWKRPEPEPISRHGRERSQRPPVVPIPGWMKGVLAGICLCGAVASGAGLAGALAPPAVAAYVAAVILVVLTTR